MSSGPIALVREVPDSFDQAIVSDSGQSLDVATARRQHAAYLRHLENAGHGLLVIPADPAHPDCVFIEDTAVIVGKVAFITRPGAPSRRGEVGPVRSALAKRMPLASLDAPGTLDGGDVIVLTGTVLVGGSRRTNPEGVAALSSLAAEQGLTTTVVPVHEGLHLKSAVLPLDDETMVVTRGAIDETGLGGFRIIYEDDEERFDFSALPLLDGTVLVTSNAPRTAEKAERLGFAIEPIGVSEIQAADGGLTCMSILLDSQ